MDATPFGDYLRQELIGRRDMREVWRDCNPKANRIVALKVLSPKLADDETFPRRFRRELDTAAGLRDPQVARSTGCTWTCGSSSAGRCRRIATGHFRRRSRARWCCARSTAGRWRAGDGDE